MCGIITVFETRGEENQLRPEVLKMSKKYVTAVPTGREYIAVKTPYSPTNASRLSIPRAAANPLKPMTER